MGVELVRRRILIALVTIDGEGVDWTTHSEDEDYALMACNSSDSDTEDYHIGSKGIKELLIVDVQAHMTGIMAYLAEFQKPKKILEGLEDKSWLVSMQEELLFCSSQFEIQKVKYVAEILKEVDFAIVKTASTPIETQRSL
ncbi:hypothetical protein Tco_0648156 [Tanacetum coccineum]